MPTMTRIYLTIAFLVAAGMIFASIVLYPRLPTEIPTHWNLHGEVDDYGSKIWAAFLMPGIMIFMIGLFRALEWMSPKQYSVASFRPTYYFVLLALVLMLAFVHALILWAALSAHVDTSRLMLAGMSVFFGVLGAVLGRVRQNFWVGVRTPWTIANERVWQDTHRLAGWLFVIAGVLGFVVVLAIPAIEIATIVLLVLIMLASLTPVLYSLIDYKCLERRGELNYENSGCQREKEPEDASQHRPPDTSAR